MSVSATFLFTWRTASLCKDKKKYAKEEGLFLLRSSPKNFMITKKMVKTGFERAIITLEEDPNMESGTVCRIGDHWFYFGGEDAEAMSPAEYISKTNGRKIVDDIYTALSELEDAGMNEEYAYYEAVLREAGISDGEAEASGLNLYAAALAHGTKTVVIKARNTAEARERAEKFFGLSGLYSVLVWKLEASTKDRNLFVVED